MHFPKKQLYSPRMFSTPFTSQKILFVWVTLGILLLLNGCEPVNTPPTKQENKEPTIFTQDMLMGIHAKMIAQEQGEITILKNDKFSPEELASVQASAIILGTTPIGESMVKDLNYTGLFVSIPEFPSHALTYPLTDIDHQIDLIRDALCEINPDYC